LHAILLWKKILSLLFAQLEFNFLFLFLSFFHLKKKKKKKAKEEERRKKNKKQETRYSFAESNATFKEKEIDWGTFSFLSSSWFLFLVSFSLDPSSLPWIVDFNYNCWSRNWKSSNQEKLKNQIKNDLIKKHFLPNLSSPFLSLILSLNLSLAFFFFWRKMNLKKRAIMKQSKRGGRQAKKSGEKKKEIEKERGSERVSGRRESKGN